MTVDVATTAVHDHLTAGNILVGRGAPPNGRGWQGAPGHSEFIDYAILWRLGSLDVRSATVEDRFEVGRPSFFVRVFAGTPSAADQLIDQIRDRMLHVPLVVPGYTVHRVWLDNSQTTTRSTSTEVEAGAYEAGDFYTVHLTEA